MSRLAPSIAILVIASCGAPAVAADMAGEGNPVMDFRSGYQTYEPKDWTDLGDQSDGLHLETGLRYWYSMGSHSLDGVSTSDTAHSGEVYLRVDDDATSTYASGSLGYSSLVTRDIGEGGYFRDGDLTTANADFGWTAFNDGHGNGVGGLIGYQYWNEAHDTNTMMTDLVDGGSVPYDTETGETFVPNYLTEDRVDIQALRLGVQGKANFNNLFDIRAEIAAVPYAHVAGTISNETATFSNTPFSGQAPEPYTDQTGNVATIYNVTSDIDTWGYGGMAEAFIGFHPTENLVFRLGGRAWYVQGTADAKGTYASITDPENNDADPDYETAPVVTKIESDLNNLPNRDFSFFRYGILAEVAYSF
jgi:hypothetical protein